MKTVIARWWRFWRGRHEWRTATPTMECEVCGALTTPHPWRVCDSCYQREW